MAIYTAHTVAEATADVKNVSKGISMLGNACSAFDAIIRQLKNNGQNSSEALAILDNIWTEWSNAYIKMAGEGNNIGEFYNKRPTITLGTDEFIFTLVDGATYKEITLAHSGIGWSTGDYSYYFHIADVVKLAGCDSTGDDGEYTVTGVTIVPDTSVTLTTLTAVPWATAGVQTGSPTLRHTSRSI